MKTATIPSLRVDPTLRQSAEDVLQQGETLSAFVEVALRAQIELRKNRQAFIARGLASRDSARQTGVYHDAVQVLNELKQDLAAAKAKTKP